MIALFRGTDLCKALAAVLSGSPMRHHQRLAFQALKQRIQGPLRLFNVLVGGHRDHPEYRVVVILAYYSRHTHYTSRYIKRQRLELEIDAKRGGSYSWVGIRYGIGSYISILTP